MECWKVEGVTAGASLWASFAHLNWLLGQYSTPERSARIMAPQIPMIFGLDGQSPTINERWSNAGLMLGQRRRRWTNIKPALVDHLLSDICEILREYSGVTLGQRLNWLAKCYPVTESCPSSWGLVDQTAQWLATFHKRPSTTSI